MDLHAQTLTCWITCWAPSQRPAARRGTRRVLSGRGHRHSSFLFNPACMRPACGVFTNYTADDQVEITARGSSVSPLLPTIHPAPHRRRQPGIYRSLHPRPAAPHPAIVDQHHGSATASAHGQTAARTTWFRERSWVDEGVFYGLHHFQKHYMNHISVAGTGTHTKWPLSSNAFS